MIFSANLGFLWADLPLPEAIRAAKTAGFDAVECHWPYDTPPKEVAAALAATGLPMLGLNTSRGGEGAFGLSALPDRGAEARAAIDQALAYAVAIKAQSIHVMAGFARGRQADVAFRDALRYACDAAAPRGITILIEPLNQTDAPGYFLQTTDQARDIIEDLGLPNLRLMFDCYHVQMTEGDVTTRLTELLPIIGHIQFADVPGRGAPGTGGMDFAEIFRAIRETSWSRPIGAEYRPGGKTEETLDWLSDARQMK